MSGTYLLIQIIGAAALLLWGIRMARTSVTRAYGTNIRVVLPQKLGNRIVAVFTGIVVATVLQNSTAVAVFLSALASQGVIPPVGGLAVMLGANVGSAIVASLLSLNLKGLWPILVAAGYLLHSFGSDASGGKAKQFGRFALGLGMVLIALTFMGQVSGELASSKVIALIVSSLAGEPVLAALAMTFLAWLSHSTIAMLLFLSSLAGTGVITDPELIVASVLGLNLGGAIPAIVMTLGQKAEARRIILGNALFRLIGVAGGLAGIDLLVAMYNRLPGDTGFKVVLVHIVFNLMLVVLFTGTLDKMAELLKKILPSPPEPVQEEYGPRYIAPLSGSYPAALPLSALTRETLRLSDLVLQMLVEAGNILHSHEASLEKVREIRAMDDKVDTLYKAIRGYAIELSRSEDLPSSGMRRITALFRFAVNLENAGDLIEKSLLDITAQKSKSRRKFSEDGDAELSRLFSFVVETMQLCAEVVMTWSAETAVDLCDRDAEFERMVDDSSLRHMERLYLGVSNSLETSSYHLDIINDLQRINTMVSSIATDIIAAAREEKEEAKAKQAEEKEKQTRLLERENPPAAE